MSLPTWNRKAPARAAITATISAFAVLAATSIATADVSKSGAAGPQGQHAFAQQQQAFGWGNTGYQAVPFAGQSFGEQAFGAQQQSFAPAAGVPSGYSGYAAVPASTYNGAGAAQGQVPAYTGQLPAGYSGVPSGYGFPAQDGEGYGFAPQGTEGYGFPGQGVNAYGIPGPTSAPSYGYNPFGAQGGFDTFAAPSFGFAPSEPNYAPAERYNGGSVAPASVVKAKPQPASAAEVNSGYTYEVAPSSGSQFVGTSTEIVPATSAYTEADPYRSITQSAPAAYAPQGNATYQIVEPSYSQAYDEATRAVAAPAPVQTVPAQNFQAFQPAPGAASGYEFSAPVAVAPTPEYYDLNAAASIAAPASGHFVQVGAFRDPNRANNLINKLASSGEQAFIVPAQVRGKLYHRVRIAAGDQGDARAVRNRVRNLGYYEARVVKG